MLRQATNHNGYNANDFLEDSSSSLVENEDDIDNDDDLTLRSPLPNFHMLLLHSNHHPQEPPAREMGNHRQEQVPRQVLKNHDDCLRPFVSALLVSCRVLRLSMETTFTAACLLHRFAIAHSTSLKSEKPLLFHDDYKNDDDYAKNRSNAKHDNEHDDWRWIIASCIFLACKVEEEPRRLRDLINMAHMITFHDNNTSSHIDDSNDDAVVEDNVTPNHSYKKQQQVNHQATSSHDQRKRSATAATTTSDNDSSANSASSVAAAACLLYWESEPPDLDTRYWQAKETLVRAEQNVLRWLAFDVTVSHPHRAVVVDLRLLSSASQPKQDDSETGHKQVDVADRIQQQRRPTPCLPADAATGTLMMTPIIGKSHDVEQQEDQENHLHHAWANLAWTFLNNTVFFVEALRHDVVSLATAALEMAREQQQAQPTRTPVAAGDADVVETVTARPFKKQKSANDTNVAVASARRSLQEALVKVQRLSEISPT